MGEAIGLKVGDPRFWDESDLRSEIDRIFDVCHSCRLCFKFCGSFPSLFEMLDSKTEQMRQEHLEAHPEIAEAAAELRLLAGAAESTEEPEEEVGVTYGDELPELAASAADLTEAQIDRVVDLCFQCKLCYPNCPYIPPHQYALDFPRLLLRRKAQRTRRRGVSWRARLMRDTERIGKVASRVPAISNWALASPVNRVMMEKVMGIHRDKLMPTYHAETFPRWWRRHQPAVEAAQPAQDDLDSPTTMQVALFSTCVVDYNDPACGTAAVQVLEHNGVEVVWPQAQACCGMPFLDGGDVDAATKKACHNVDVFAPLVERGYAIVVPSPSCSLMVRDEYPQMLDTAAARRLGENTYDLNAYLYRIAREGRLKRDFERRFDRIPYHVPCHLRAQNMGFRGRDLLRLIADEVPLVQECSGHDGTWSMQREHFGDSLRWGEKAFAGMRTEAGQASGSACTDCRLAALHLRQGAERTTVHPVVALAHAYGLDAGGVALPGSKPVA